VDLSVERFRAGAAVDSSAGRFRTGAVADPSAGFGAGVMPASVSAGFEVGAAAGSVPARAGVVAARGRPLRVVDRDRLRFLDIGYESRISVYKFSPTFASKIRFAPRSVGWGAGAISICGISVPGAGGEFGGRVARGVSRSGRTRGPDQWLTGRSSMVPGAEKMLGRRMISDADARPP